MSVTEEEEDEEGLGEPLILRIDQDDQGSVGSEDSTRFDSDDDMPPIEAGTTLGLCCRCPAIVFMLCPLPQGKLGHID